ncbi:MAG: ATP-binding protein [Chlamydiales bacterium]|nr:ATP-binding protein [Chlamydiales bacterium]
MRRLILSDLRKWRQLPPERRKPLIVRGARQVGKTWAIRELSSEFKDFIEINFELDPQYAKIFDPDLNPNRILNEIEILQEKKAIPGQTLLFLDEIQIAPKAIQALRYFYEKMPELHVIAAGSLIEFVLENTGLPVGRIESLYLRPMSFLEFLAALGYPALIPSLFPAQKKSEAIHSRLLELFGEYLYVGGMPEVVDLWKMTRDPKECRMLQNELISSYRSDFHKYAKNSQYKYLDLVFNAIPPSVGKKFIFSRIADGVRKRDIDPCIDLLVLAGVLHKVFQTSAQKPPLTAGVKSDRFKLIMGDVGLLSAIARHPPNLPWHSLWNKGDVGESVVGQECLAYQNPHYSDGLFYWHREKRGSSAEVDYLIEIEDQVIPIEVKSGDGRSLRSLKDYLGKADREITGYRLSLDSSPDGKTIKNLPLYGVISLFMSQNDERILNLTKA